MFTPENTILIIVDVQEKLARVMHQKDELIKNTAKLIQSALTLDIPIFITEQAPEKIGNTIPALTKYVQHYDPIIKESFSCCGEPRFLNKLAELERHQVIVAGIETHVCVYQTVSDLLQKDYVVQVVADAVSSRTEANKQFGLHRIESIGGQLTCTEMILCELIKTCAHKNFKELMSLIK